MKIPFLLTLTLIMAAFATAQQPTKEQVREVMQARKQVKKMKGQAFPDYSLVTQAGNKITSDDTKGKYVLFNFWFTRCRPCIEEIPELNELVDEYADNEHVLFLAPTFEKADQVDKFGQRFDFNYQLIPDEKAFCLELNVRSYPTHFIINPNGIIEKVVIGYSSKTVKTLRKSLEKLLAAK